MGLVLTGHHLTLVDLPSNLRHASLGSIVLILNAPAGITDLSLRTAGFSAGLCVVKQNPWGMAYCGNCVLGILKFDDD